MLRDFADFAAKVITWGVLLAVVVAVVLVLLGWVQGITKAAPERLTKHAELYRSGSCIVTRVTVAEPNIWRKTVTEFLVIEGGMSKRNGQLQAPYCDIKVLP